MIYGGDYNPEQWPEEVWGEDVAPDARGRREPGLPRHLLVGEAGAAPRRVRLRLAGPGHGPPARERRDGRPRDRHRLAAALAGPAAPREPAGDRDGVTLHPGARQHYCPSSAAYRSRAAGARPPRRRALRRPPRARHVARQQRVRVHVRPASATPRAAAFRAWLQDRYGTSTPSTRRGGRRSGASATASGRRSCRPACAPTFPNPTQQLDYHRFSSDALLECFTMERDILREVTPGRSRDHQLPRLPEGAGPLEVGG